MKGHLILFVVTLLLALFNSVKAEKPKVLCYYANWSQYRTAGAKFLPEDINPKICTHIIFAFAKLVGNRLAPTEWNDDTIYPRGLYRKVNDLKKQNPSLKVLLAVGGWSMGVKTFSLMASTASNRQEFVETSIDYLRRFDFDGLDLDWEYPAARGSPPVDKKRFTYLVQDLRNAFEKESRRTGRERLLLSAAVVASPFLIDAGYEVAAVGKSLDMINLMSYDLHGTWETKVGHHSPLYPYRGDPDPKLNVEYAAKYWASKGAPREKIIVGLPTYGRTYTLANSYNTGMGAPVTGGGTKGKYSGEDGILFYYEICESVYNRYKTVRNDDMKVPYAVQGNQWVGYDDEQSIATKLDWLLSENFGGAMIWAIDLDDFSGGFCGKSYPLLSVISDCLQRGKGSNICRNKNIQVAQTTTSRPPPSPPTTTTTPRPPSTTTTAMTTTTRKPWVPPSTTTRRPYVPPSTTTRRPWVPPSTTTRKPWVQPQPGGFRCPWSSGMYADPYTCRKFHVCIFGKDYKFTCPSGTGFSTSLRVCTWMNC